MLKEVLQYLETKTGYSNVSELISKKAFHRSLFVCCAEAYYFIMNIQTQSFEVMLNETHCEILQTYRAVGSIMVFDNSMPLALRRHFIDIENDILSRIAWKDNAAILQYESAIDCGKENTPTPGSRRTELPLEQQFFHRVLIYSATQMYHLCSILHISDELMESIWAAIKHVLTQKLELVRGRHLDQIIFCTIYCVSKIFKVQIKFQEIINKFFLFYLDSKNFLWSTKLESMKLFMKSC